MRNRSQFKSPIWSLQRKEKGRCEFKVKYRGSENSIDYCFRSKEDCLHWICHEIMRRVNGRERIADGIGLSMGIEVLEDLLMGVAKSLRQGNTSA